MRPILAATYLNSYLEDFAVLSNLTDSVFYSTTMDALSAFAPVIRGSDKIRFLQNIEETMATATYNLLQSNNGGFTFIYDDNDSKCAFNLLLLHMKEQNY